MSDQQTPTANTTPSKGPASRKEWHKDTGFVRLLLSANISSMRGRMIGADNLDPRRSIDDECGYPNLSTLTGREYQDLYDKNAVAARVVEVMPKESWQVTPLVYSEEGEEVTEFEKRWDSIGRSLKGERSYHRQEQGSGVWEYLKRLDEQCGIGSFGVMLLGFSDIRPGGKTLKDPVDAVMQAYSDHTGPGYDIDAPLPEDDLQAPAQTDSTSDDVPDDALDTSFDPSSFLSEDEIGDGLRLLFLRVFPEALVYVSQWDTDPQSPRYAMPKMYTITMNDPNLQQSGAGLVTGTHMVHWTRVLHLADNLTSSEVFGVPRNRPVLPNLMDIYKVAGSSAEMYFRGAFPGMSFETHPQMGGNVDVNEDDIQDMYEKYINGMDRSLILKGMQAKMLAPTVVDPTPQVMLQIKLICIKLGIPERIFMGSERGELASTQDDDAWNDRIKSRQNTFITPRLIVPFIDRLINAGVLPVPENGYVVEWPDITSASAQQKATVSLTRTQALVAYVTGNGESAITLYDFLTRFLEFTEEEANEMINQTLEQGGEQVTEPMPTLPKGDSVDPTLDPDPSIIPGAIPTQTPAITDEGGIL